MNIDQILRTFNHHRVAYLLIGGMNFLLRHKPILTFDIDLWIEDNPENLERCESAVADLDAQWGPTELQWGAVKDLSSGWLRRQMVFCLISPHGAIDIFRGVKGLGQWSECANRALAEQTAAGTCYQGLADADLLACQRALELDEQKVERTSRSVVGAETMDDSLGELLALEEGKRAACWNAVERWRVIEQTIDWAEGQQTVRRNTKETALRLQAEKLRDWPSLFSPGSASE